MTFEFLITTINKTYDEIVLLLEKANIRGRILVGNQCAKNDSIDSYEKNGIQATIYNQSSTGVSLNRNFLIRKSTADYVMFLDDDVILEERLNLDQISLPENIAFRFNCHTNNKNREIKQIKKSKKLKFNDVKSYGVWGIFFPRLFLINNDLFFNESIGPGRYINHGEDSLFLRQYLKHGGKLIQFIDSPFLIEQFVSTWKDKNIERELISHGFVYKKIFGLKGFFYLFYYCLKHRKEFKKSHLTRNFFLALKMTLKGFKLKDREIGIL